MGFRTFTIVWKLLWYCYCPVYQSPTQWVWYLIWSWLCSSYHLAMTYSLSLDRRHLFLVGSSDLLMVVQRLVAVLVSSKNKMSTCSSTPSSWATSHQQAEQCLSSLFTYLCLGDHRYSKYLSEYNELGFFLAMSITLSYVWIYLGKIFFHSNITIWGLKS